LNMIQEANDYLPSSLDMELRGRRWWRNSNYSAALACRRQSIWCSKTLFEPSRLFAWISLGFSW
jgi:hypothetical protein